MESDRAIAIVDQGNRIVGEAPRREAHLRGLWHRSAHCIVFDDRARVFSPQRDDVVCPNLFDISMTEHVRLGESFEDCCRRGLARRLGVDAPRVDTLSEVFQDQDLHDGGRDYDGMTIADNRFVQIFAARWNGPVRLDTRIYLRGEWFAARDLDGLMESETERFAPHFCKDWKRVREALARLLPASA